MNRKERRTAQKLGRGEGIAAADQTQRLFAQALQYHQLGQFAEAERCYRSLLASRPRHEHSLYNLGILALQTDRPELAVDMLGKAVSIDGGNAEWRYNYAFALQQRGRAQEAIEQYSRAVTLRPDYAEAQLNLGNLLLSLGRPEEATSCYERLVALKPDFAETHYNLGNVLAQQGRIEEAIASFERSIAIKPLAEAHNNLGIALARTPARAEEALLHYRRALALNPRFTEAKNNIANVHAARGEWQKAAEIYGEIIEADPKNTDAHENLARTLIAAGEVVQAVSVLAQGLNVRETPMLRRLFVTSLRPMRSGSDDPALRELVRRALTESWGDPGDLANIIPSLIKATSDTGSAIARAVAAWPRRLTEDELFGSSKDRIVEDRLLVAWLQSMRATDLAIERFLTMARSVLLRRASADPTTDLSPHEVPFWASLAQQCFTNEYVFAVADNEWAAVTRLRHSVAAAFDAGQSVATLPLLAFAAFSRLDTLPHPERLLARDWPSDVEAVLTQQIVEPEQERELSSAMAQLTPIVDETSRKVQAQYEQNPYPRWIKAPPPPVRRPGQQRHDPFAGATIYAYGHSDGSGIEALVAGCGTGQHAVDLAQKYPQARFLAVDLSLTSLGYAARKTRELGLSNIEYAQADILELGGIGRSFDVIEASGVLHHLADPFAGWRVLLSLLKPNGYMQVGLYSELARQQVVAARRFIAERGYTANAEDIRRARQDLADAAADPALKEVTELGDFFTVSDCRDLLFHVQEHRLTLPRIKAFLQEAGLRFLGFDLDSEHRLAYARQWPDDRAMAELDQWHIFETKNPRTFLGMYQFWVQRL